jgi:glyoxylase-like metal-dependent hydrolase (beta-lactamase superfamily II)
VSVAADPRPAQLPLPGGRDGATVRVHPLLAGEMRGPGGWLASPGGQLATLRTFMGSRSDWVWMPIPAFLVEHPSAGPILIDTGLHPSVAVDPGASFGTLGKYLLAIRMEPEQALPHQLRARGVQPRDVSIVVMTHMHFDHASGVSEFPDATFVLDRREWHAAADGPGVRGGYLKRQFDHGFDWRTIDYDAREIDSFASFGRAVDVFGDGSVRLLSTPGHTAGHQSVLLRLHERELLLTGDAAYLMRTISDGAEPLLAPDRHRFHRSLAEIRRFIDSTPGLVVITGHDADQWPTLEPVYD